MTIETSGSDLASPYQSPDAQDDHQDLVRPIMGEHLWHLGQYLGWAGLAFQAQATMMFVTMIFIWNRSLWAPDMRMFLGATVVIALLAITGLTTWAVIRLASRLEYSPPMRFFLAICSLVPFLALLSLFIVIDKTRGVMAKHQIPLLANGVDWVTLKGTLMQIFGSLYQEPSDIPELNQLYNLTFCDDLELARLSSRGENLFQWPEPPEFQALDKGAVAKVHDRQIDPRVRIYWARWLKDAAHHSDEQILAIIWDIPLDNCMFLLACYDNGMAILIDESNEYYVEPIPSAELRAAVDRMFDIATQWIERITPYDFPRPIPPAVPAARLTLITTHGTRVIEQPWSELTQHPTASQLTETIDPVVAAISAMYD
ncbi:hypothetical protein AB1L30_20055 [Bremerella sp. JC817]|uniref:hypothetical protein n=1 Tax=Bremerella sp. JC817 TaxID=3231756 RepID=UPI00345AC3B4